MDKDSRFFCIKYDSAEGGFDALMFLAEYELKFSITINPNGTGVFIVYPTECKTAGWVDYAGCHEDFGLAEMDFQMNYRQVGMLCPVCEKANVKGCCGHLTFDGKI